MPNADDTDPITDKRLTDLEVKASFSEDLLDHLNDLVARQQEQIDLLIREVGKLKDRAPDTGGGADARSARGSAAALLTSASRCTFAQMCRCSHAPA